ncbi:MAG: aldo/keto reductase [Coriobacteriia bacterium]|nr:aldo/keto reductase [Coriobacteriia bacterium]
MIYRNKLSLLGFGIMRLPIVKTDSGAEDIDTYLSTELIDYALANGVNYFDTAWPYHEGQSESFLGKALVDRHPREDFYLATKLPLWEIDTPADADTLFARQLTKLRTDYVDFYLMHALDGERFDHMVSSGLLQWAVDLQKSGKIGRLGFSFHGTNEDLARIIAAHSWDFGQLQLNYLDWELQKAGQAYNMLTDAGIPVIVMEPVRGGKLASLIPAAEEILKTQQPGKSVASWAFRFVGGLPNVMSVLSGMSTLDQLKDNIETFSVAEVDLVFTSAERGVLDSALEASQLAAAIPCTACKYCMPCPYGVDIAGVFGSYNAYKMGGSDFGYKMGLKALGEDALADSCIDCGDCVPLCPQQIDISQEMEAIATETAELLSVDEYRAERADLMEKRGSN